VPASSGTPTRAKSKYPKRPAPASAAASETITLTGVPVSASIDPACAANTIGSSSRDGCCRMRVAAMTTTGRNAAIAPLTLMKAVATATASMIRISSRDRLSPARRTS
jgi:hypothetical protein